MTEHIDPETGEVFETTPADGGYRHRAANTIGEFFHMLEDGQFGADVMEDLRLTAEDLENRMIAGSNGKLAAELTIKVKITREDDGIYRFQPSHSIKMPKEVRPRSIGWLTDDNRFTPNKPHQGNLFGVVRDVTARPRNIIG